MSLGKQVAAYTLASSFPDGCGNVQDAPPNPFSVFFPPSFIYWFCFYKHYSHLFSSVGAFVFPIPYGIGEKNKAAPLQKCVGA